MKLRWFEVENFRSIVAPTRCSLEGDITVLAGKNESGKSNLLNALVAFSSGKFSDTDSPGDSGSPSTISTCFAITRDEIEQVARTLFEFNSTDKFETKLRNAQYELLLVRKSSDSITVSSGGSAIKALEELQNGELEYWTGQVEAALRKFKHEQVMDKQRKELAAMEANDGPRWLQFLTDLLLAIGKTGLSDEEIEEIRGDIEEYKSYVEFYSQDFDFIELLWKSIPEFVLFDSFDDILPDEADEDDVESKTIIQRFFTVADVEPNDIFSEKDSRKRKTIVDRVSSNITGDFCGYYQQSEVKIQLDVDGPKIQFYIKDGESPIPFFPGQRSQGFQWFLSFYLTLKSTGSDKNLVILIDEPGLYLHPKAQQEVLQVLETLSRQNQIIFSTHSPYLIDIEHLNRVRLVLRETAGGNTVIENKIQKVADKDTLTPIVTAIGYSFGQGLSIGRSLNIVTEGISDAYYLRAFIRLLAPQVAQDIGVIGAVGANQVPNVVSILLGWGVRYVAVFDNDREGKTNHTKLVTKLGLNDGVEALFVSPNRDECIEDLFSVDDFYQYVLDEVNTRRENAKNSQIVGNRKVLLAKKFYELVSCGTGIELSLETQGNVLRLLDALGIELPVQTHTT